MNYNFKWISAKEALEKMSADPGLDGVRFTHYYDWNFPQFHMFDGRISKTWPEDEEESYTPEEFLNQYGEETFRSL